MKILISLLFLIFVFSSCQQQAPRHSFPWKPYSQVAIENSIANKKPIVIDFSAEWCPICHDLDRTVFFLPEVQSKLAQVTTLRMDMTDQDDPQVQKIGGKYEIEGLPTVIFLDSTGKEINRIIGFVTPQEFLQALAQLTILK